MISSHKDSQTYLYFHKNYFWYPNQKTTSPFSSFQSEVRAAPGTDIKEHLASGRLVSPKPVIIRSSISCAHHHAPAKILHPHMDLDIFQIWTDFSLNSLPIPMAWATCKFDMCFSSLNSALCSLSFHFLFQCRSINNFPLFCFILFLLYLSRCL